MATVEKFYETAVKLAKEGGKLIKERIWAPKNILTKSSAVDFVTETDQEVEKLLISGLNKEFPDHKFIGEETTASGVKPELTSLPTWVIDPVDGTTNFVHGFPCVCVSIGLLIEKVPHIGIIYNPVLDQLFTAKKGQGAFLNGKKINVSKSDDLSNSLLIYEFGSTRDENKMENLYSNMKTFLPHVHGIRSNGSAAWNMAMVSMGAADAYFEFGPHIWDVGAGSLIVTEAGGTVIDPAGGPFDIMSCRMLCASTPKLANQIVPMIKQFYPPRDDA